MKRLLCHFDCAALPNDKPADAPFAGFRSASAPFHKCESFCEHNANQFSRICAVAVFTFALPVMGATNTSHLVGTWLAELRIGTNTYHNVTLTKRSDTEAVARFDGGIRRVSLADLPEPLRSAWYDAAAVQERIATEQRSAREAEERRRRAEEAERKAVRNKVVPEHWRTPEIEIPPVSDLEFAPPRRQQSRQELNPPAEEPERARSSEIATGSVLLVAGLALYFIPSGFAYSHKHRNTAAIVALNLFLGWTFIGWVVALVWSLMSTQHNTPR